MSGPQDSLCLPRASLDMLKRRAEIVARVRQFFRDRGFLEVETPVLSRDCTVERHLTPWTASLFGHSSAFPQGSSNAPKQGGETWFLQNSPEFHMKRLLAAGMQSIVQFAKAFRADEQGRLHNPEFTMLEWYRVGDDYGGGMDLLDELCQFVLERGPAERLPYRDAFLRYVNIDPWLAPCRALSEKALTLGLTLPSGTESWDLDQWLNLLLAEVVEPKLGRGKPTLLMDYPPSQGALACIADIPEKEGHPSHRAAQRFELYVEGIELANGYCELLDPEELLDRNRKLNRLRVEDGAAPLPEESKLLDAMRIGLPPCSGVALGFDRLVMLAVGVTDIGEVIAFPFDRA